MTAMVLMWEEKEIQQRQVFLASVAVGNMLTISAQMHLCISGEARRSNTNENHSRVCRQQL